MDLFRPLTLQWWQVGLFKLGMLALGLMIGAAWPGLFAGAWPVLVAIAVGTLGYITYLWLRTLTAPAN